MEECGIKATRNPAEMATLLKSVGRGGPGFGRTTAVPGSGYSTVSISSSMAATCLARRARRDAPWLADHSRSTSPGAPSKIVALWNNFAALCTKLGKSPPLHPMFLIKPGTSVIGPNEAIRRPTGYTEKISYEGELGVVIGKTCKDVHARRRARSHFRLHLRQRRDRLGGTQRERRLCAVVQIQGLRHVRLPGSGHRHGSGLAGGCA